MLETEGSFEDNDLSPTQQFKIQMQIWNLNEIDISTAVLMSSKEEVNKLYLAKIAFG